MTTTRNLRRCKLLAVDPHLFAMLFTHRHGVRVVKNPLPDDAQVIEAFWDAPYATWLLKVHSDSYPETLEGCRFPNMEPPVLQRLDDALLATPTDDRFYQSVAVDAPNGYRTMMYADRVEAS